MHTIRELSHIFLGRHVWIERVVLENHCDIAIARRQTRDVPLANLYSSGIGEFEAGDDAQQGRLAAPAWPQNGEEAARLYGQIDAVDRRAQGAGIGLRNGIVYYLAHFSLTLGAKSCNFVLT